MSTDAIAQVIHAWRRARLGQTEAQAQAHLRAAEEKREWRAVKRKDYASRAAEGQKHSAARIMRSTVTRFEWFP
jgi:hypothetical protein